MRRLLVAGQALAWALTFVADCANGSATSCAEGTGSRARRRCSVPGILPLFDLFSNTYSIVSDQGTGAAKASSTCRRALAGANNTPPGPVSSASTVSLKRAKQAAARAVWGASRTQASS